MIELNRENHTYSGNLPGVTSILKAVGIIDTAFYSDEGRDRGTAVHLACEYFDQGDLDESSIDPQIAGYLDAYKRFRSLTEWQFEWIEMPIRDRAGKYAGTPDRGLSARPRKLIDIKTGAYQPWHAIQAAAYVNCLEDPFSYSRYGLYLKTNGTFSMREFPKAEYVSDLAIFQSALNIYYWKGKK